MSKRNATLLLNCMPILTKKEMKIYEQEECLQYSPYTWVFGVSGTSLEPGLARVLRLDCPKAERAGKDVPGKEPSWTRSAWFFCMGP